MLEGRFFVEQGETIALSHIAAHRAPELWPRSSESSPGDDICAEPFCACGCACGISERIGPASSSSESPEFSGTGRPFLSSLSRCALAICSWRCLAYCVGSM